MISFIRKMVKKYRHAGFLRRLAATDGLTESQVRERYVAAGIKFGMAVSRLHRHGEGFGFTRLFRAWQFWEIEYSFRGYCTLPIEAFVEHAVGGPLRGLDRRRAPKEPRIFHAERYRQYYLHRPPNYDFGFQLMDGQPFYANRATPTTDFEGERERAKGDMEIWAGGATDFN